MEKQVLRERACWDCKYGLLMGWEEPCADCRVISENAKRDCFQSRWDMSEIRPLKADDVNHPAHYQGRHECLDEMIALFGVEAVKSFCRCNVYKYRFRAAAKNGQEDLDKAENYLEILMRLEAGKPWK